jgi:hypothetical protein
MSSLEASYLTFKGSAAILITLTCPSLASRVADPDPHGFALFSEAGFSYGFRGFRGSNGAVIGRGRSQWRRGRSKSSPGGSVDHWLQICITFDQEVDPDSESH